jgi:hypothetical protein
VIVYILHGRDTRTGVVFEATPYLDRNRMVRALRYRRVRYGGRRDYYVESGYMRILKEESF